MMIDSTKSLMQAIELQSTRGYKADAVWQGLALRVAAHFKAHGNNSVVNALYLALNNGSKRSAMKNWLLTNCGVKLNDVKETKAAQPFIKDKAKVIDLDEAAKVNWFAAKPPKSDKAVQPYDAIKAFTRILNDADKAVSILGCTPGQLNECAAILGLALKVGASSAEHDAAVSNMSTAQVVYERLSAIKRGEVPEGEIPDVDQVDAGEIEVMAQVEVASGGEVEVEVEDEAVAA